MRLEISDYNGSSQLMSGDYHERSEEIESALVETPLHLKASDQSGIVGNPIFDPVGTNEYIRHKLTEYEWTSNIAIPSEFKFLGTGMDFGKQSTIVEVQFSNYPFLLNNIIRSEFFFKSSMRIERGEVKVVVVVTKAHMFPASNSTLYYEQAKQQLDGLSRFEVFDVPIRLVGLFEDQNVETSCIWTEYTNRRYSRTVSRRFDRQCEIVPGARTNSRCILSVRS